MTNGRTLSRLPTCLDAKFAALEGELEEEQTQSEMLMEQARQNQMSIEQLTTELALEREDLRWYQRLYETKRNDYTDEEDQQIISFIEKDNNEGRVGEKSEVEGSVWQICGQSNVGNVGNVGMLIFSPI